MAGKMSAIEGLSTEPASCMAVTSAALPGITPEYCADYAIRQMKRRKVVIVPTLALKAATTMGRFIPQSVYIAIAGHQQKKKLSRP